MTYGPAHLPFEALNTALKAAGEATRLRVLALVAEAELTVSDEGEGIPPRVQKRIFERFYTGDSAGGSGLGLAIASELAQRMRGRITISSSRSNRRFTAFTLDLPPTREAQEAAAVSAPSKVAS